MTRARLRATATALLGLVASSAARAEIDHGTYELTAPSTMVTLGQVEVTAFGDLYTESWVVPAGPHWSWSVAGTENLPTGAPVRPGRRCPPLVQYSFRYAYESLSAAELLDLVDELATDPDPTYTDRVLVDGQTVGWRIRERRDDGTVDETWLLTRAYAPPLPTPTTPREEALRGGWARPYGDTIVVTSAPVDDVLDEVVVATEAIMRTARYSYLPQPATPAQVTRICGR